MKQLFLKRGYAKLDRLIPNSEVENLRALYDQLLQDKERTMGLRSDLGGGEDGTVEKITQIMRPSLVEPKLSETIFISTGFGSC